MMDQDAMAKKSPRAVEATRRYGGSLWAIVLAGGEGVRLRPLVRQVCGDERPKQYVPLLETRSLLQQTLDRLPPLIPSERTVLVTMRNHLAYVAHTLGDSRLPASAGSTTGPRHRSRDPPGRELGPGA